MNWCKGDIAEAVSLAKTKNAIFVVYVDGTCELSEQLRGFIDADQVKSQLESDKFVAIKITSGSEAYMQFAQIYQVVPVPSLFLIGKNGLPLEIVTGVVKSVEEVVEKINSALGKSGFNPLHPVFLSEARPNLPQTSTSSHSHSSTPLAPLDDKESPKESVPEPENDVVKEIGSDSPKEENVEKPKVEEKKSEEVKESKTDKVEELPESKPEEPEKKEEAKPVEEVKEDVKTEDVKTEDVKTENVKAEDVKEEDDHAAQLEKAKKLIEEKRKEREAEEAREEREREIQRRKQGQEAQNLQRWQQEQELQQLKESIRRERLEEQAAKQKILEKIASDRAERAQKFGVLNPGTQPNQPQEQPASNSPPAPKTPQSDPGTSRIQFRKPDGESVTNTFDSSDKFHSVREYVKTTVLAGTGIKEFSLATTFPKKEFTVSEDSETLFNLGLCPNAVLLIITTSRSNSGPSAIVSGSGGFLSILSGIFYGLLSPFVALYGYLSSFITGNDNGTTGAQKRAGENSNDHDAAKRRNLDRFGQSDAVNDGASTSFGGKKNDNNAYRRVGNSNIHRLHETKDSDDENNTWNGNSTQQQ